MGVDLHIHTTYSDGSFTPQEVVLYAKYQGISAIAITDHDTVEGNEEAIIAGKKLGVEVVPGVEISVCHGEREIHLLGYFIDYKNKALIEKLERLRNSRKYRNPLIIEKLREFGINLNLEKLKKELKTENICRPHIAREMVKLGYVRSVKEAFDLYLKVGMPAYVPKEKIKIDMAIKLVKESGGLAILAHPATIKLGNFQKYYEFISTLKEMGLDGVETFYNGKEDEMACKIADILNLLKTAGSDFHGINVEENSKMINYPYEILENLKKRYLQTTLPKSVIVLQKST